MLTRSQSTFIYSSGIKRTLSIVSTPAICNSSPLPPQIIFTHDKVSRVYGRERLMSCDFDEVVRIFRRDFGIKPRSSTKCLLDEGFCVTFYRTHGHGDTGPAPMLIDPASWHELLRNVTRIRLGKPETAYSKPIVDFVVIFLADTSKELIKELTKRIINYCSSVSVPAWVFKLAKR